MSAGCFFLPHTLVRNDWCFTCHNGVTISHGIDSRMCPTLPVRIWTNSESVPMKGFVEVPQICSHFVFKVSKS